MPLIATTQDFTPLASLLQDLAPLVTDCLKPVMEGALRSATREFLCLSHCWRQRGVLLATTVSGQGAYVFNPPANAELHRVHACWDGTREVDTDLPDDADDMGDTPASIFTVGVSDSGAQVELYPPPLTGGIALKGTVSYTLAANGLAIPTWIYLAHRKGIAKGAAAELVLEANKPWSRPEAYVTFRSAFTDAVATASNKAGRVRRRPMRTRPACC